MNHHWNKPQIALNRVYNNEVLKINFEKERKIIHASKQLTFVFWPLALWVKSGTLRSSVPANLVHVQKASKVTLAGTPWTSKYPRGLLNIAAVGPCSETCWPSLQKRSGDSVWGKQNCRGLAWLVCTILKRGIRVEERNWQETEDRVWRASSEYCKSLKFIIHINNE